MGLAITLLRMISLPVQLLAFAAALGQAPGPEPFCRYSVESEQKVTRTGPDGFSVTVRRKMDPAITADPKVRPAAAEDACVIEVRDRSQRVVFARAGFNARLHEDSGRDVDNDGAPDLIVGVETHRTKLCCSEYSILSLKPDGPINTKELFLQTVCAGRPEKGMPAWCALGMDPGTIDKIYSYVKARSDAKMSPGRPARKEG